MNSENESVAGAIQNAEIHENTNVNARIDNINSEAVPPQNFTVEDLIQTTVRTMLVLDEQRRQMTPSAVPSTSVSAEKTYSNKEIEKLLPEFAGLGQNINIWLERLESVQRIYKVPNDIMQLIIIGKLTKNAKEWFHSKVDYVELDFLSLKYELKKMYSVNSDPVLLRKSMEKRRWRKGEKFSCYYHEKILLGNNARVPDTEMIHYIIDGLDDKQLQSQVRLMLNQISSTEDLFNIMNNVIREETPVGRNYPAVNNVRNVRSENEMLQLQFRWTQNITMRQTN